MSTQSDGGCENADSAKSPAASKLENLSREDLIKFVKKQMLLGQKTKKQCDELTKELVDLKTKCDKDQNENSENDSEMHSQLMEAYNASQQSLEMSASRIQVLTEQVDCMKMKEETMMEAFQSIQEELRNVTSRNKDLEMQVQVLTEARDNAVEKLSHQSDVPNVCSKCSILADNLNDITSLNEELKKQVELVLKERGQFELDLQTSQEILKNNFQSTTDELKSRLELVLSERNQFEQELHQTQETLTKAVAKLRKLKQENEEMKKNHETVKDETDAENKLKPVQSDDTQSDNQLKPVLSDESTASKLAEDESVVKEELNSAREKLAEWEAMMKMLETERNDMKNDLSKFMERDKKLESLTEDLLRTTQNAMQGRDMFTMFREELTSDEDAGQICNDLRFLQSIIDEMLFERDETKEKIHHLSEEVADLKDRNERMVKELEEESEKLREFEERAERVTKEKEDLFEELNKLKENFKLEMNEKDELSGKLVELTETIMQCSNEKDDSGGRLNEIEEKMRQAEKEKNDLLGEVEELKQMAEQALKEKDNLSSEISRRCEEIDLLKKSEESLLQEKNEIAALVEELKKEKEEYLERTKLSECNDLRIGDDDQIGVSMKDIEQKMEEINLEKMNVEKFKNLSEDLQRQVENLVSENNDLKAKLDELEHPSLISGLVAGEQTKEQQSTGEIAEAVEQTSIDYALMTDHVKKQKNVTPKRMVSREDLTEDVDREIEEDRTLNKNVDHDDQEIIGLKERIKMLEEEKIHLEKVNNELKIQLDDKLRELDEVTDKLKKNAANLCLLEENWKTKLENVCEDKSKEVSLVREELEFLKKQLQEAEDSAKHFEDEKSRLVEEVSRIEEINEQLFKESKNVEVVTAELEKASDTVAELNDEIEKLRSELNDCKKDMCDKDSDIEKLKVELESVSRDATDRGDDVHAIEKELQIEIQGLKDALDKAVEENADNIRSSEIKIKSLEDEITKARLDAEQFVIDKENEIKHLKEIEIEGTQKEIAQLRECLAEVKIENESIIESRTSEIQRLEIELDRVSKEFETVMMAKSSEIELLAKEMSALKSAMEDKCSEIQRLEGELISSVGNESEIRSNLEKLIQENQQAIHAKDDEIEKLKGHINTLVSSGEENSAKDVKIAMLNEELDKLKQGIDELMGSKNQEIAMLQAKCDFEIGGFQEEKEKLKSLHNDRLNALQTKLERMKNDFENLAREKESEEGKLQTEMTRIREDVQRKDHEIHGLNEILTSNKDEQDRLNEELQKALNELSRVEGIAKIHETEIASLKNELDEMIRTRNEIENVIKIKDFEIEKLKEELQNVEEQAKERLDVSQVTAEKLQKSESDASTNLISSLQEQLKEKEDRENKLKQLTLKAKKESTEWKAKFEAIQKELNQLKTESEKKDNAQNSYFYQSLQTEYDKLETNFEEEKSQRQELQKALKQAVEELSSTKSSLADVSEERSRIAGELQKFEKDRKDLEESYENLRQELQAEKIQRETLLCEKTSLESKLLCFEQQLRKSEEELQREARQSQEQLKSLKDQLSSAKREMQQSQMINLEIADYERTVRALNETVIERDSKIKILQEDVDRLQEQKNSINKLLESSESQYKQAEEHSSKLKQLLVKAKKDLSDAKKLESEQRSMDAQMRGQLEMLTQLSEEQKIQISSLLAENHKLSEKLQSYSYNHQRSSQTLELRIQSLEHDLETARSEVASIHAEYEGYKVRVHSVLKQQKTKTSDDFTLEQERTEKQNLEKLIEQLKAKLQDMSLQVSMTTNEYELLQEENERLQQRYAKLQSDIDRSETGWKERLEKLNAANSLDSLKKHDTIQQLTFQNETLALTFKEQIRTMQDQNARVVESLRNQLDNAEIEIDRYRSRLQNIVCISSPSSPPPVEHDSMPDRPVESMKELRVEERQSGEGSENVEDLQAKLKSSAPQPTFVPFEQLLSTSTQQSDDAFSVESAKEDTSGLALVAAEKQIDHLRQLLNESEATVLRLTEQAMVLKGEIRRMERNQERETAVSNMEYLKNVVYKFLTLKGGDERMQLIPVLTTMLKFSPEEKDKLIALAAGAEGVPGAPDGSGWGAYLHRWSGMV